MFGWVQTKFSRSEVEALLKKVETEAKALDLIPANAQFAFVPGSSTNGVAPSWSSWKNREDGQYEGFRTDLLPEIGQKDTRNTVGQKLAVTLRVLETVRKAR
jgi:hypothetical protein